MVRVPLFVNEGDRRARGHPLAASTSRAREGRGGRTDQRRAAVFALYQRDVTGRPRGRAARARRERRSRASWSRASRRDRDELDELIARHASGWTLDRIAPLERNILRVALYEMLTARTCPTRWRSTRRSRPPRSSAPPTRRASSTASWARSSARTEVRMNSHRRARASSSAELEARRRQAARRRDRRGRGRRPGRALRRAGRADRRRDRRARAAAAGEAAGQERLL